MAAGLDFPFALTPDELWTEWKRLEAEGWLPWEINERLGITDDAVGTR